MTHPCENKCPNFTDEQCCHCLVQEASRTELMDSALKSREEAKKNAGALKEEVNKHFACSGVVSNRSEGKGHA